MKKQFATYYPGFILFVASVIIGFLVCGNYGMAWDEPAQRLIGQVNYNYIFNNDPTLLSFADKEYGAAFELPLIFIEKIFHLTDLSDIYIARHLATHIFFLIGAFSFYILVYGLFRKQWIAILGFAMLVLMPRIYAHSFFNTKDIPFLSAVIISLMLCQMAFTYKRPVLFLIAGISAGYFTSIRIMGIMPLAFILLFLIWDIIMAFVSKQGQKQTVVRLLLFLLGFCGCLYATWPLLWQHPVDNFIHCLQKVAGKEKANSNLIMGLVGLPEQKQWEYLPVWLSITIPALWLLAGIAGIITVITTLAKRPLNFINSSTDRIFVLHVLCFLAPVTTVIVFNSAIYDEWRHLYFIYPSFVITGLYAINKLANHKGAKLVMAACTVQIVSLCWFMIKYHPYQYVYFNSFVSHKDEYLRKNFEFDYWGLSVQQALQHLLNTNPDGIFKVCDPGFEPYLRNNVSILPANERSRIKLCNMDECDYFITTFRYHPEDFPYPVFYSIRVLNSTIVRIYKIR